MKVLIKVHKKTEGWDIEVDPMIETLIQAMIEWLYYNSTGTR